MKIRPGNTPILVKPMLGKRPEFFNPIDVVPSFGYSLLF